MQEADKIQKWRLILGSKSDPDNNVEMEGDLSGMGDTLDALYDSDRKGGLGASAPNVNRWLGDIRTYFPSPVVQIMQRDALHNLGLNRMLLEPELLEAIEADVHLVGTLISLSKILPDRSKETARQIVKKLTDELEKKLKHPLIQAIRGSLRKSAKTYRPKPKDIDWHKTIRANLKHYQADYKTIIPERLIGYDRRKNSLRHFYLLLDQSGSMADSVVYASVISSILASLSSIKTEVIAFDTQVVDLTEHLDDPVDLLFAVQLGGGTHIAQAVQYVSERISQPKDSIVVLLSDLFEGGHRETLFKQIADIQAKGAQFICLLALNDEGAGAYDRQHAQRLAQMGIPTFASTPDKFPNIMAAAIAREPIKA